MQKGKIMKGIAGFYYVYVAESGVLQSELQKPDSRQTGGITENGGFHNGRIYACKARGIFRKENQKPLVGDDVMIEVTDEKDLEGNVVSILPRKNELFRPSVANIDQAVLIFACRDPEPNRNLLDRFLITMEQQQIPVILCFNKSDLANSDQIESFRRIYETAGYPICITCAEKGIGMDELSGLLAGKTSVMAGPSGVGKSTVINYLSPEVKMETGTVSEKIGRGRHTTRHAQLIPLGDDSYLVDTPGFTSLTLSHVKKEELSGLFPEFRAHETQCRFAGCSHISEPDCGVLDALQTGEISPERYESYRQFFKEIQERRNRF